MTATKLSIYLRFDLNEAQRLPELKQFIEQTKSNAQRR